METRRVRIAVAMNCAGEWYAVGWENGDPEDMSEQAMEANSYGEAADAGEVVWVEADVPLPREHRTVTGKVTP